MAAGNAAIAIEPQPHQHIASEGLGERHALASHAARNQRRLDRTRRQAIQNLFDQGKRLLDLTNAGSTPAR